MSQAKNVRVIQSTVEEYVEIAREEVDEMKVDLPVYKGELFSGPDVTRDLVNVLSNKIRQKQENYRVQASLQLYAEPMSALVWQLFGSELSLFANTTAKKRVKTMEENYAYDTDMFWYAWKLLLLNHPHDSIAGCSTTEVHKNVDDRFLRSKQVGELANYANSDRSLIVCSLKRL